MSKPKLIGIAGLARTGKDTLYERLQDIGLSRKEKLKFARVAFADPLKSDINNFLSKNLGISAFTKDPDEKKILRPIFVGYGEAQRALNPDYWIERSEPTVNYLLTKGVNVCITDVRYKNEANWILENGVLVYIERENIVPPNQSEANNIRILKKAADIIVKWPEMGPEKQKETAKEILKGINSAYWKKFGFEK